MKKLHLSLLIAGTLLGASCSDSVTDDNGTNNEWELTRSIELTPEESEGVESFNDFSYELIGKAFEKNEKKPSNINFSCSPVSASIYFSMIANAAGGESRKEVLDMLKVEDINTLNSLNAKLMHYMPCKDNGAYLAIANAYWVAERNTVTPDFETTLKNVFNGEVKYVDFGVPSTADAINKWAKENSNGMIPIIIHDWRAHRSAEFFSADAVCFNGTWSSEFKEADTKKEKFNGVNNISVVDMMNCVETMRYLKSEKFQMVEKTFRGGANYVELYLPEEGVSLKELVNDLVSEKCKQIKESDKEYYEVTLSLPKFSHTDEFDLTEISSEMGVSLDNFDFSAMGLKIGQLECKQNTSIKFDEHGVELAAITSGGMTIGDYHRPVTVNFNRPFFYIVRNKETDMILMAGAVRDL